MCNKQKWLRKIFVLFIMTIYLSIFDLDLVFIKPLYAEAENMDIACGTGHSVALKNNGKVYSWGYGGEYILGHEENPPLNMGIVTDLTDVKQISAGERFSLVLKNDGSVWGWGNNSYEQLTSSNYGGSIMTPVRIPNLTNVISIASRDTYSAAVKADGTVWIWGRNNNSILRKTNPSQIVGLTDIIAVALGHEHLLALKRDGTVYALGSNTYHQLGNDGYYGDPVKVKNLTNVTAIAAGDVTSYALKDDGTVWQWGDGKELPSKISTLSDVISIAAGHRHALALKRDGTVWAWGANLHYELGTTNNNSATAPVQVKERINSTTIEPLDNVVAIAAGAYNSLAVKNDGTVLRWGTLMEGTTEHRISDRAVHLDLNLKYDPPATPQNIYISANNTFITVSWNAASGATGYDIEADGTVINTDTSTSYTHNNLAPNTSHTYRVRAKNAGGTSDWTSLITKYTLANVPNNGNVGTKTSSSIQASWGANDNPDGTQYLIAAFDGSGNLIKQNSWTANLSATVSGLNPGTTYKIKVKAKNGDGVETSWYEIGTVTTLQDAPGVPSNLTATPQNNSMTISWNAVSGATGYDIETDGRVMDNGSSITYTHSGLSPNSQHSYRVRAKNSGGTSGWTSMVTKYTLANKPADGTITDVTTTGFTVAFGANGNPTGTQYKAGVFNTAGTLIIETSWSTSLSANIDGLLPDTSYNIKAKAKNGDGIETEWQDIGSAKTLPNAPITAPTINVIPLTSGMNISWNTVTGTTGYILEKDGQTVNVNTTSYSHTGLNPNTSHAYRVKAVNEGGEGPWSQTVTKYTLANVPANGSIGTVTKDSISASWQANSNPAGTEYRLAAFDESGNLTKQNTWIQNLNDTISGLNANTEYTIKFQARNHDGIETAWYTIGNAKTLPDVPSVPKNISASAQVDKVTVTWDNVANASGYDVEADGVVKDNGISTTFTHTGLTPNSSHAYRVRAKNSGGAGAWSEPVPIYTLATVPSGGVITDTKTDSITASWEKNGNADGTLYSLAAFKDGNMVKQNPWTVNLSDMVTGLQPGTEYVVKVKAKNYDGIETEWHEIGTATTKQDITLKAPIARYADALSDGTVKIVFEPVENASSYILERSEDGSVFERIGEYPKESLSNERNCLGVIDNTAKRLTRYYYQVRAKNGDTVTEPSNIVEAVTAYGKPDMPGNFKAQWSNEGILLTWDQGKNTADNLQYEVSYKYPFMTREITRIMGRTTEKQLIIKPDDYLNFKYAKQATAFYVKAIYNNVKSDPAEATLQSGSEGNGVPMQAPSRVLIKSYTDTTADIEWTAVEGATEYTVTRYKAGVKETEFTSNGITYHDTGLSPNTEYYYTVKAGRHPLSEEKRSAVFTTKETMPGKPARLTAEYKADTNSIELSITPGTGSIDKYFMERTRNGIKDGVRYIGKDQLSITDDLRIYPDTTYVYKLYSVNSGGKSEPVEATVKTPAPGKPEKPQGLTAVYNQEKGAVELTIIPSNDPDVKSYRIERYNGEMRERLYAVIGKLTYEDDSLLKENTTYTYKCYAITSRGNSDAVEATVKVLAPVAPEKPSNLTANFDKDTGTVKLTFTAPAGDILRYQLERYNGSIREFIRIIPKDGTSYNDGFRIKRDTTYKYKLYSINRGGKSEPVETEITIPLPQAGDVNLTADEVKDTQVTLKWDVVNNSTVYILERYKGGTLDRTAAVVNETTFVDDLRLTPETEYQYKIKTRIKGYMVYVGSVTVTTDSVYPAEPIVAYKVEGKTLTLDLKPGTTGPQEGITFVAEIAKGLRRDVQETDFVAVVDNKVENLEAGYYTLRVKTVDAEGRESDYVYRTISVR